MCRKYSIGVDFGSESGRVVLVDLSNGEEIASHVTPYRHKVIHEQLPESGVRLDIDWVLQHPGDYLEVLENSIPMVMAESGVNPKEVIGLGIDFTSCTMIPVDETGEPLCFHPELKNHPHSWVKLWKHHAAHNEASLINEIAEQRGEGFLSRYGGKTSPEGMIAKIWQVLHEAPGIYDRTDLFMDAADWIVYKLTGNLVRNCCSAGYKSLWHKHDGYPGHPFFKALDPRLEDVAETKLRGAVYPLGTKAGELTEDMARVVGLERGTSVAAGAVDAHAAVAGMGVVHPGKLVMAMGTAVGHMLLGTEEKVVEGICGVVEDGIIPGYFGYEAGQPAVGDIFAWFVERCVPAYVMEAAEDEAVSVHEWLEWRASTYKPGETGLLALDWWNGNRSILADSSLSGLIIGYTLQTKPEEVYRALMEATAFGTRKIIDAFQQSGIAVQALYACGGLPQKNRLLMQIFADVTNREIHIAGSKQTPALGAAMFGAVAAGSSSGGYDSIAEAAKNMTPKIKETYRPIPEHAAMYERLYLEYSKLHEYFGRSGNDVMKHLKSIREGVRA